MDLADALNGQNQSQGGAQWPGQPGQPSNPGWPGQPSGNSGWPSAPSGNSGWPSAPSGNSGWPSAPSGNSGWPSAPSGQPAWPGQADKGGAGGGGNWPSQPNPPAASGGWPNPPAPGPGPAPAPAPVPAPQHKPKKVPHSEKLPSGVYDKMLITIKGTVNQHPNQITLDMMSGKDVVFHLNPRFNEAGKRVIVRNSCMGGKWGKEERDLSNFPFSPGSSFEMKILCTNNCYRVAVNGSHLLEFQHRCRNLSSIKSCNIYHDLTLSDVLVEKIA
ncbi:galectin-5-like [Xyrichtys novacula]|uniref:Galectin n=1 Tax=Xyrichtys novacula TaxID=13765 RepID=A0AAV1GN03_XYRNO|nr:galectin-5-like [Xyrichtys novacula]